MRKGLKNALNEIGKHFLNVAVAVIVFSIIQPLINGKFQIGTAILFIIAYFILVIIATVFIIVGGKEDE
ncbi:hypothetical protein [Persephonella sp.]